MTYKTAYWDEVSKSQKERDCTPEETAEIDAAKAAAAGNAKTAKALEINLARAAANQSTFTFAGKQIACDQLSRSDIDAINGRVATRGTLPPSFPGAWKAVDNTYVGIPDVATWNAFYDAMVAQGTVNFVKAQTLKAALAAANTPAEIAAVTW